MERIDQAVIDAAREAYRDHRALWVLAASVGLTPEDLNARTRERFGVVFEDLTPEQAAAMLPVIREAIRARREGR